MPSAEESRHEPKQPPPVGGSEQHPQTRGHPWAVFLILLLLAAYLFWLAPEADVPLESTPHVDTALVRVLRPRATISDPPRITIGGYDHRCNGCHRLFESRPETPSRLMQHRHIHLNHGINDRCFNCHLNEDRERLVLRDGTTLSFDEIPVLCAGCHGTTYRDWQAGTHGKTLGAWSPAVGPMERLICTECHNPHSPAYPGYKPLPGPNTLRMGEPVTHGHENGRHRPLSPNWVEPDHAPDHGTSHDEGGHE